MPGEGRPRHRPPRLAGKRSRATRRSFAARDGQALLRPARNPVGSIVPAFRRAPVNLVGKAHDALCDQGPVKGFKGTVIDLVGSYALSRAIVKQAAQLEGERGVWRELAPEFLPSRGEWRLIMARHRRQAGPFEHLARQGSGIVPAVAADTQRGRRSLGEHRAQKLRVGGNRGGILPDRTGNRS